MVSNGRQAEDSNKAVRATAHSGSMGPDDKEVQTNTLPAEISSRQDASRDEDDCCVICLDRISEGAVAHPCQHASFDFLCLISWLQERATCPLCKAEVKKVRYGFGDDPMGKIYTVPAATTITTAASVSSIHRNRRGLPPRRRRYERLQPASRSTPTADEALVRRRHVYHQQLYSLHVGTNRISRFREFDAAMCRRDGELVARARRWIRRELQVFAFLTPDGSAGGGGGGAGETTTNQQAHNAEFLLEYVVAILKTIDLQGSAGQAVDLLREFLGLENARLFLHELRAWLRSPYTSLADWDRHVQYHEPGGNKTPTGRRRIPDENAAGGSYRRSVSGDAFRYPPRRDRQLEPSVRTRPEPET